MRASHEHQWSRLKAAVRSAVNAAGTAEQFCEVTRVSEGQVSRYANMNYPDFMPLDVVLDCELAAGQPIITQALASMQGYRLAPVDGGVKAPISAKDAVALMEGGMLAVKAILSAVDDGHVDEGERREIERKINAHMQDLQDVLSRVRLQEV